MFKKVFVPLFAATVLISGCNKEVAKESPKDKVEQHKKNTSLKIDEVKINTINGKTLMVDVKATGEKLTYAYYIYKGEEIVEKIWYKPEHSLKYEVKEPGKYKVKAYAKDANKKIDSVYTNEVTIEK
ncbi:triple tyrosine motif-containing protein [Bacillus sp. SYJ]|uniref:triple tyrosine motif-containing protein n=1 Tax=Bacillus sp. SYJ TaxID=2529386 RepID=UPI001036D7EE|nr:triple tyrosine motif-containing protein [Bacillus sp. SYJ]